MKLNVLFRRSFYPLAFFFFFYSGTVEGKLQETSLKYKILTGQFLITNNAICQDVKARTFGFRT
jgi:hypothetical protein